MRWDDVLEAITNVVTADATLVGIFGTSMRAEVNWTEQAVPGVGYRIAADSSTELWEPCVVEMNAWTDTFEDLAAAERRLRALFDHAVHTKLGGVDGLYCYSQFTDGTPGDTTAGPDRSDFYGRVLRFRISPIREALQREGPPIPVEPPAPSYEDHYVSIEGSPTNLQGKAFALAADDSIIFAAEPDGAMYRSTDDGHTFSLVQNLGAGVRVVQVLRLANDTLIAFVRTNGVIWASSDNGQTWVSGTGPAGTYARNDASVQLASGRIVSGCHNGHAFTSDDNGASWTDRGQIGTASVIYSMEVAANGNVVAGSNEPGGGLIYVSTDSGATWTVATTMPATKMGSVHGIALAADGALVATGGITNDVWRSTDHGVTWTEAEPGIPPLGGLNLFIYRVPASGTLLTIGTGEASQFPNLYGPHVRRSTDHGLTWDIPQNKVNTVLTGYGIVGRNLLTMAPQGDAENGREFLETSTGAILACLTGSEPVWRNTDDGLVWLNPTT
jgi:hypothetical protein